MAEHRPEVPTNVKKRLRREAGDKCANPGCPVRRSQYHHIREWAVYRSHDPDHMIAVCPTCHDAIHHGRIALSDDIIYAWKRFERPVGVVRDLIYVEPGRELLLLLGTFAVATAQQAIVFSLLEGKQSLRFRVVDGEIFVLGLEVADASGRNLLRVSENHVVHCPIPGVEYASVSGRIVMSVPESAEFVPPVALAVIKEVHGELIANGRLTLLAITVEEPGVVRVAGCWSDALTAIVIGRASLTFVDLRSGRHVGIAGAGKQSRLVWDGPIDEALFQRFGSR